MGGDLIITVDGSGILSLAGLGSLMIPGDGVCIITVDGTGEEVLAGTGFLPGSGDLLGSTGTGDMIISVGVL